MVNYETQELEKNSDTILFRLVKFYRTKLISKRAIFYAKNIKNDKSLNLKYFLPQKSKVKCSEKEKAKDFLMFTEVDLRLPRFEFPRDKPWHKRKKYDRVRESDKQICAYM